MNLAEKIIKHRKANGWSQEDLAEKLNVSRQAVSRWENETALPDAQNVLQISKLFRVTTDYLLNDDCESDSDVPFVKSAKEENEFLSLKKRRSHLAAAIGFTVASFCWLMAMLTSSSDVGLILNGVCLVFSVFNAVAHYVMHFYR